MVYFQEWLDINAISSLSLEVTESSDIKHDWLSLMNVCSQMKYYTVLNLYNMVELVREKWKDNLEVFINFKHITPFIIYMVDNVSLIAKRNNPT